MSSQAGWKWRYAAKGIYKVYRDPTYITMTGSDVTKELSISYSHRIIRMSFYHTTSAYAASTDNLLIRCERKAGTMVPDRFEEYLFNDDYIRNSRITYEFGEGYEYEGSVWKFTFNTTNTDLIYPVVYVQKLDGGE